MSQTNGDNLCVLCFKQVEIYSIGVCDHPVCYECSTRMRILCKQNECPICRANIPRVYFVRGIKTFQALQSMDSSYVEPRYGLIFASLEIQRAFDVLLEHKCSVCSRAFRTFAQLKDHMRREHELFYCELCVENVKIFSSERRTYTRQELGLHRRKGDPDNTSHRGHPLCEFCDTRFMDSDELFRHLRRTHLFCHLCDADGRHLYYKSIDDLRKHFRDEHHLCEEGDCRSVPMTAAFRTEIDLKAHVASAHGLHLSKSASKVARTLELEFNLVPRKGGRADNAPRRRDQETLGEEAAASSSDARTSERLFFKPLTTDDFPALGNNENPPLRPTIKFSTGNKANFKREDFPSLGENVPSSSKDNSRQTDQFPPLAKPSTSKENSLTVTVNQKLSIKLNGQTVQTKVSKTQRPKSEPFPALGGGPSASQPQWVKVKTKKKEDKPQPKPASDNLNINNFPDLKKKNAMVNLNKVVAKTNPRDIEIDENSNKKIEPKVTARKVETVNPPPGFSRPPPPGLSKQNFPALGPQRVTDVTFTTSNGRSYSISPCNDYRPPSNFSQRNQNIVKRLSMVTSPESLLEFKTCSDKFRNDEIGGAAYYEHCKKFLGVNFDDFFPELLALLPNVAKQQELFRACGNKCRKAMVKCERCGQIIFKKELTEHYKYHTLEL